jgi:hypothetical protein
VVVKATKREDELDKAALLPRGFVAPNTANAKQSSLMTLSQVQGGGALIVVVQPQFEGVLNYSVEGAEKCSKAEPADKFVALYS